MECYGLAMFAFDSRCRSSSMSGLVGVGGVLEAGSLTPESLASFMIVAVVGLYQLAR
jgi:hypothetical protein